MDECTVNVACSTMNNAAPSSAGTGSSGIFWYLNMDQTEFGYYNSGAGNYQYPGKFAHSSAPAWHVLDVAAGVDAEAK